MSWGMACTRCWLATQGYLMSGTPLTLAETASACSARC